MTALAEALLAAQRQAIGALGKASVAGAIDEDDVIERLRKIGCNEAVDLAHILAAWDLLREFGAQAPAPAGNVGPKQPDPPTDAQRKYIAKLCDERNLVAPDHIGTKDEASEIIERLKAGTYNADAYTVPF